MPQPTAGQFAIVCSELSLGQTARGSRRGCLSANASGRVCDVCGDACGADEVRRQPGRDLADAGRHGHVSVLRWPLARRRWQAEVIFSSRALSVAPFIIGGLLYSINPQTVDLLFTDPTGNKLLAYAVGFGADRALRDPLDDQKGDDAMTAGLSLVAFAIAAATAAFLLIIREIHFVR